MDTATYTIVETGQSFDQGLRMWTHEQSARLFATETFDVWNKGRMITRPITLLKGKQLVDHYLDGQWVSGYVEDNKE